MIERGIALARRRGDRVWELSLTANLVDSYFESGRWDEVERVVAAIPEEGRLTSDPVQASTMLVLAQMALYRGELERVSRTRSRVRCLGRDRQRPGTDVRIWARVLLAQAEGRHDDASPREPELPRRRPPSRPTRRRSRSSSSSAASRPCAPPMPTPGGAPRTRLRGPDRPITVARGSHAVAARSARRPPSARPTRASTPRSPRYATSRSRSGSRPRCSSRRSGSPQHGPRRGDRPAARRGTRGVRAPARAAAARAARGASGNELDAGADERVSQPSAREHDPVHPSTARPARRQSGTTHTRASTRSKGAATPPSRSSSSTATPSATATTPSRSSPTTSRASRPMSRASTGA